MTDRNIQPFANCTTFSTTTQPFHLINISPVLIDILAPISTCLHDISKSTINPYQYSFFINLPFLWNTIPIKILQSAILRNDDVPVYWECLSVEWVEEVARSLLKLITEHCMDNCIVIYRLYIEHS